MRDTRSRGASIFAAILFAAILAGAAYLLGTASQVLPSANSQGADVGSFAQPQVADIKPTTPASAEDQCKSGYDYKIAPSEKAAGSFELSEITVCVPGTPASSPTKDMTDRGCRAGADGKWTEPINWVCVVESCVNVPPKTGTASAALAVDSSKTTQQCVKSKATKGGSFNRKQLVASTVARKVSTGDITPEQAKAILNPLTTNKTDSDLINAALSQETKQQAQRVEDARQTYESLTSYANGCAGTKDVCDKAAAAAKDAQTTYETEQQRLNALDDLKSKATSLSPTDENSSIATGADAPDKKFDPCSGTSPVSTCTDKPYNPYRDTGFGDGERCSAADRQACGDNPNNRAACMRCMQGGGNPFGQQSGQRNSSPSGGQQQQPQQQCQPRYFCNNNSVMYAPCYNRQPGNAQTVQQCPQNYTCSSNTNSNSCQPSNVCTPPPQPAANLCTVGSWTPVTGQNGCITNWQCGANGANGANGAPTAQLACQPKVADAGMTIMLSYACTNATASSGSGFDTGNQLSGSTTTVIQVPSDGTNLVNYTLTCTNSSGASPLSSSAQCAVQTGKPSIMLVATPEKVPSGQEAALGWVTVGQQSCTIADADYSDWTAQNAGNTSVAGTATTPPITHDTTVTLTCRTVGGATQQGSVNLKVI